MERIKNMSLKKSFLAIIVTALLIAMLLSVLFYGLCQMAIEHFELSVVLPVDSNTELQSNSAIIITGQGETAARQYYSYHVEPGYSIITFLQMTMPVVFIVCSLIYADIVFYRVKLKRPIQILRESAERIQKQDLDFEITGYMADELGELCSAFEIMRKTLLSNNWELWRQTEERKRLNAAFSHDLRNPVAVLKGSAKLLQKNMEQNSLDVNRAKEPVDLIYQYAERMEHYIEIMTKAQKLEELECNKKLCEKSSLQSELENSLSILAEMSGKKLILSCSGTAAQVLIDKQFLFNTAENLISNALRYADKCISVDVCYQENQMTLCVTDDGKGYSDTLLKKGITPFLKSEETDNEHFGMGLYLCKLLCEKHGGSLAIQNHKHGAKAIATFQF